MNMKTALFSPTVVWISLFHKHQNKPHVERAPSKQVVMLLFWRVNIECICKGFSKACHHGAETLT